MKKLYYIAHCSFYAIAFAENEIPILMQKEIEPSLEDIVLKLTDNTTEKEENINESDI